LSWFPPNIHRGISLLYIWVRNNYLTSLGIYLVLPVDLAGLSRLPMCPAGAFWLGLLFVRATSTRRRGGLSVMIGRGGFFMPGFGTLELIEYNGKFHD
jgi:hypothetical protein